MHITGDFMHGNFHTCATLMCQACNMFCNMHVTAMLHVYTCNITVAWMLQLQVLPSIQHTATFISITHMNSCSHLYSQ